MRLRINTKTAWEQAAGAIYLMNNIAVTTWSESQLGSLLLFYMSGLPVYDFSSSTDHRKQPIRSSSGNSPPLSKLPKMAYRSLAIRAIKEQVFGSFILLITHSTERILMKGADSVNMLPQVTMSRDQTYNARRH
ncbi:hypothetical protein J6590_047299 [Homalodisca vitripennis]|nr:hypothetical protein J6590_047299 [Homalodisca vitripennis]